MSREAGSCIFFKHFVLSFSTILAIFLRQKASQKHVPYRTISHQRHKNSHAPPSTPALRHLWHLQHPFLESKSHSDLPFHNLRSHSSRKINLHIRHRTFHQWRHRSAYKSPCRGCCVIVRDEVNSGFVFAGLFPSVGGNDVVGELGTVEEFGVGCSSVSTFWWRKG
jgi:hypothetical protein